MRMPIGWIVEQQCPTHNGPKVVCGMGTVELDHGQSPFAVRPMSMIFSQPRRHCPIPIPDSCILKTLHILPSPGHGPVPPASKGSVLLLMSALSGASSLQLLQPLKASPSKAPSSAAIKTHPRGQVVCRFPRSPVTFLLFLGTSRPAATWQTPGTSRIHHISPQRGLLFIGLCLFVQSFR